MKKIINSIMLSVSFLLPGHLQMAAQNVAPTSSQNYTVSYKFRQALTPSQVTSTVNINQAIPSVTYYDGIGRVIQNVEVGETPLKRDKVVPVEYDLAGRADIKKHLPYPLTIAGGGYQASALTAQKSYYTTNFSSADANFAYQYTEYEKSSLDRVTATRKPGSVYQSYPIRSEYSTNTASDNVLRIRCNTAEAFYTNGNYPANKLFKTTTTNEDGLKTHVFTDFLGRTVLQRTADGTTVMDTYYVYAEDNFGHLKWVITPEGAKSLGTSGTYNKNDNLPKQFCYYYQYNGAGDVIEKREPGADPVYMRYNVNIGRKVVASQSGSQRAKNEWFLYEYNPTGDLYRMYRYTYKSGYGTPAQIDSWITSGTLYASTYIQEGGVVATYEYDRYSSGSALTFQAVSGLSLSADQSRVKGLKTYEKILNTDGSTYTERRFYYDSKTRVVQIVERNHLGYTSRYSYEYDFMGNTLTTHESHQINSSTTHVVLNRNTYDHRNRLLNTTTTLNSGTPATVTYTYDELGMTKTKKMGSASTVTNQYNIQGWLTSQNSAKFSLALDYFGASKRAGNITKLSWGQGASTDQFYTLTYDLFGRLKSGVHSLSKFNETIGSYDLNGNIKSLTRTANGTTSDNYTYNYTGNQLTSLSGVTGSYTYDASGNLKNDPRKNLAFTYNSLNLLSEVKTGSTVKAKYLYSYDGKKMRVLDAAGTNGYEYLGGLTLVKTNNAFTPEYHFGEGVIRGTQVMYFEKDHLGSIRSLLNTSGTVLEKNDYYPFGLRHTNSSHVVSANNRYKFNGKEDQIVGALSLLDYGARMYDQQIGRWLGIDPLSEKYYSVSSYAYCMNNPIKFIDIDGRDIFIAFTGGPFGSGKNVDPNSADTGSTGRLFQKVSARYYSNDIRFRGTVITPGITAGSSVKNAMSFINENYIPGENIIIYGYSYGGDFAVELAEALGKEDISVDLLITVDASDGPLQNSTVNSKIPENVVVNYNYYQTNHSGRSSSSQNSGRNSGSDSGSSNSPGSRGGANKAKDSQKTIVNNINLTGEGVTHGNIPDKAMSDIEEIIRRAMWGY